MFIARFSAGDVVQYGVVEGTTVRGLKHSPFSPLGASFETDGSSYRLDEVKLLAPSTPTKIVALGLNYRAHAQETHAELPKVPLMFLKPSSAVIGPGDEIVLPTDNRIDHEAELGIVIGRKAKDVPEAETKDYVLGYTCVNDVSEREIQKSDVQWSRAKGFDTFAPMGPWIATDINADDLKIEALVNGQVKQSSRTSNLIFGISRLVSFISGVMTLFPGDVIATGTPEGVSPLKHGDVVEIRIENIGTLRNYVVRKK
ncbi:MAG: fumarylacetoacetate hydrolase family protein [Chloroflexi bacterium]|nr:fumarylacetoacetate hydrolase family protein [Chloroflexota bacterium]